MKIYPNLFSAICLLAVLLASLAQAQSTCTPEHAAMGHCTMDAPKTETTKPEATPESAKASNACTAEHAAMGHCKMEEASAKEPLKPAPKPKKANKKQPTKAKPISSEAKSLPEKSQACTPEHAAMGHCTMDAPKVVQAKPATASKPTPTLVAPAVSACTPEHAAMGHCTLDAAPKVAVKPRSAQAKPVAKTMQPVANACTPEHAAMGHCKLDTPPALAKPNRPVSATNKPAPKPLSQKSASTCTPEHAAMGHCTMPRSTPKVSPAAKPSAPVASTCTPEHAAMGHCTMESNIPVSDGSAETNIPMPYHHAMDMNDDPFLSKVMIDRFEVRQGDHGNPVVLEADAWFGKSVDKLWLKTDIEAVDGELEEAQLQVLYNRAISPFWDVQAGIRHDFKPLKRTWAALGVQGTAPYFIETDATLFLGKSGQTALNVSAEKEIMLTQKTVLIPEVAMTIYGKDDHELGVGSGVSDLNVGLRLSHEFRREFAPYIGVNWSKKLGKTADLAEHHGDKTQDTEFLLGIQAWF